MRITLFVIAVLCAAISGWAPVLAQTQNVTPVHHDGAHSGCDEAMQGHDIASGQKHKCRHAGQSAHLLLCAACFAVLPAGVLHDRRQLGLQRPHPRADIAVKTADSKPRFPPPKFSSLV